MAQLKVHYTETTTIMLDAPSVGVLLLNGGVDPGAPPERMRLYGHSDSLEWPDGTHAPGIVQPVPLWYVETEEAKVLVDTGTSARGVDEANAAFRSRSVGQVYVRDPAKHDIDAFLEGHGTHAEEIDLVILTHLHHDHFSNVAAYPNARFLVQRKELPWGLAPPPWAQFHWREFASHLTAVIDRIDTVDGDANVLDGIDVWHVGGHTPGSMAVAVTTAAGKVVIGGDFFYNYRSLDYSWPPGSFWSLEEWEANCAMIKRRGDIVLPGHDYELWQRHPGGTIG